jgi:hypothetical protein
LAHRLWREPISLVRTGCRWSKGKVLQSGYSQVTKIEADDGRWEGIGIKNGQKMEFYADPKTGLLVSEKLDD